MAATLNKRYADYRRNASTRGLVFELTKEQFDTITQEPCTFCGSTHKVGVDRIDNNHGYTLSNSQPACKICNKMKNIFSVDTFLAQVQRIAHYNQPPNLSNNLIPEKLALSGQVP